VTARHHGQLGSQSDRITLKKAQLKWKKYVNEWRCFIEQEMLDSHIRIYVSYHNGREQQNRRLVVLFVIRCETILLLNRP